MHIGIILLFIAQSIGVSIGVGSSTLAIVSFFTAISDGKMDDSERHMLSPIYIMLRIAMSIILVSTALLTWLHYSDATVFLIGFWTLIGILYVNAILMTKHIIPVTVGPALQASTWYTLGVMEGLFAMGQVYFTTLQFFLGYAVAFLLAMAMVNGMMAHLKHMRESKPKKEKKEEEE